MEREILRDTYKIWELYHQIFEVMAVDDNCDPSEYADHQIINEALHVRTRFTELSHGWEMAEEFYGYCGKDQQKIAKREFQKLERFLKKWMPTIPKKLLNPKKDWYLGNTFPPLLKTK